MENCLYITVEGNAVLPGGSDATKEPEFCDGDAVFAGRDSGEAFKPGLALTDKYLIGNFTGTALQNILTKSIIFTRIF